MPNIVRSWNSSKVATLQSGHQVERQERLYLKSHQEWYDCLPTEMHFCFFDPRSVTRKGSTIYCTCGSPAGVFGRDGYRQFTEVNYGVNVIACTSLIQTGVHADGSHE